MAPTAPEPMGLPEVSGSGPGARIRGMTAKEKVLERAPRWSEAQAERALLAAEDASEATVDEWGDLSKLHEVSFGETMQRLAEEERAARHDPW
jgi:hypothetical protein